LVVFCLASFPGLMAVAEPEDRPNVVLIFVDDLGYGDAGCYGGDLVPTPHIERLAAEGIRFTRGYSSASVCAPSRAGLLTGAYQQRFGMQSNFDRRHYRIPESHAILPEAFRSAGYRTAAVGKWNIIVPPERALDRMYSRIDWESDFWPIGEGPRAGEYIGVDEERYDWTRARHVDSSKTQYWGPLRDGDEYLTDRLGRQAVEFIEENQETAFFVYLAFNAVHTPLQAKKAYEARVAHIEPEPLRMYAAMLISMDEAIGAVLDALDANGLAENTIVAFLSDNGQTMAPIVGWREDWSREPLMLGSAGGLRGHKGGLYEGGHSRAFPLALAVALGGRPRRRSAGHQPGPLPDLRRGGGPFGAGNHRVGRRQPAALPRRRGRRPCSRLSLLEGGRKGGDSDGRLEAGHGA